MKDDKRGKAKGTKNNLAKYQWVKGESGNPSGRPIKNAEFIKALKEYGGDKPLSELNRAFNDVKSDNNRGALDERIWRDATGGNYQAIKMLMDVDGIKRTD